MQEYLSPAATSTAAHAICAPDLVAQRGEASFRADLPATFHEASLASELMGRCVGLPRRRLRLQRPQEGGWGAAVKEGGCHFQPAHDQASRTVQSMHIRSWSSSRPRAAGVGRRGAVACAPGRAQRSVQISARGMGTLNGARIVGLCMDTRGAKPAVFGVPRCETCALVCVAASSFWRRSPFCSSLVEVRPCVTAYRRQCSTSA